jgi:glycosyltransferase involved in cell wall biosynthesis
MTDLMLQLVPELLTRQPSLSMLFIGHGSNEVRNRIVREHRVLDSRLHATGVLNAAGVSLHIGACDVMLQPYQDGVSGRRTSVMTALAHGIPIVTTIGRATEAIWLESEAVTLATVGDIDSLISAVQGLLDDAGQRTLKSRLAVQLYRERFNDQNVVTALREGNHCSGSGR